jgi:UDP-N-acetylglucosamine diphosphorylase/glucosamine-1-phosphate N-acetyltransferase
MTIGSFTRRLAVVVLAAGKGTRMESGFPKVLHLLNGRPMISYVLDVARSLSPTRLILVVGFEKQIVKETVGSDDVIFVDQDDPQGTGHAVLQTEQALKGFAGDVMILSGDVPLLTGAVVEEFVQFHRSSGVWLSLMTAEVDDPTGYGRIVRDESSLVSTIVEHKDADEEIRNIKEYNAGIYLVKYDGLFNRLKRITNDNAKGEYYVTDLVKIAVGDGKPVAAFRIDDANLVRGINTVEELEEAEQVIIGRDDPTR